MMVRCFRTTLGLAALGLLVSLPPPLDAHAASNATCDRSSVKVEFVGSWGTETSTALTGFEVWEWDADKYNGGVPVAISTTSGQTTVAVGWSVLSSDSWGVGLCDLNTIFFNLNKREQLLANQSWFLYLSAHEMGHAIGLDHVGKQDSYNGDNPPVMWSCGVGNATYRLKQDDNAGVQIQTDATGVYRSATANSSFEEDGGFMEFWGKSSSTTATRISGGVDGTPYSARISDTSAAAAIFSTTALIDDPTIDWVVARANYRKILSSHVGTVNVQLRVRTYDSGGSSCGFPARKVGSHSYGTAYYYSKTCTPTTSWNYCTTAGQDPATKNAETGGVEVRVYFTNNMTSSPTSGHRAPIDVDRLRVLVDY